MGMFTNQTLKELNTKHRSSITARVRYNHTPLTLKAAMDILLVDSVFYYISLHMSEEVGSSMKAHIEI